MSLRLWGTISGWGKSAGTMIPALGSGRYAPGPNIVWPSWLNGSDPNYTINACWRQPGLPATVSKFIGQFFAGGVEVDQLAQLDGLPDSVAIACPQLNGLHGTPPLDAKDTILRLLSTFPHRRAFML